MIYDHNPFRDALLANQKAIAESMTHKKHAEIARHLRSEVVRLSDAKHKAISAHAEAERSLLAHKKLNPRGYVEPKQDWSGYREPGKSGPPRNPHGEY